MRNWYRKCRTHHNKCRGTTSRGQIAVDELHSLPLRVIDVGPRESTNDPRLVDTTGFSKGHWVALSHCWGDLEFHPLKTTRANVNEHMRSIPFSTLPKTFVDAIVVTRALSLRYLWIDSLCIIQDDEEDWRTQSREMGVIYEHAVLTVAAS
ncbi:heterokaryon incompatibility protein-domain-containing protein, partial [Lophiotrema nucula]